MAVVIPARDEEEVLGEALDSLRAQQFEGEIYIFVVDDDSSDATGDIARSRGATVLEAGPLPPGWTGKLWAVSRGVQAALAVRPDYILLTDADIAHGPTSVRDLVARDLPLASVMVKLRCESRAERLLVPAFVFFFFKLYPPKWIADPAARTAGAAGGCILIRPEALERIGGIAAIRGELIDDCALARAVKQCGPIWLGMSSDDSQHSSVRHIRGDLEYGGAHGLYAVASFDAAPCWNGNRDVLHVSGAAHVHFRRLLDGCGCLRWNVHSLYPDAAVLRTTGCVGAPATGGCRVLSRRYDSLGRAVLARGRRPVEGARAGSPLVDFDQFGRRNASIRPAFGSVRVVLGVNPPVQ